MSVWNDIRKKSLGKEKRLEDTSVDECAYATKEEVKRFTFFGIVDSKSQLPSNSQTGHIYQIKDTNELVLYTGNRWEVIISITREQSNDNVFDGLTPNTLSHVYTNPTITAVTTESNSYETHIREHSYQGPQDF